MKRTLHTILILLLFSAPLFSQNIILYDSVNGQLHQLAPDAVITKQGAINTEIIQYLAVKNNTAAPMNLLAKKEHLAVKHGAGSLFCWTLCFDSSVYVTPDNFAVQFEAGVTRTDLFSGHYLPFSVTGQAAIRYTFYEKENHGNSVSVTVEFSAYPVGVGEPQASQYLSEVFPNPVSDKAGFNYEIPEGSAGEIIIRNLLGSTVRKEILDGSNGRLAINTMDLKDGLYFYTLLVNGDAVLTRKMVVKH